MKYEVVEWEVNRYGDQVYAVRKGNQTYFTGLKLTCESKAREYEKLDKWENE